MGLMTSENDGLGFGHTQSGPTTPTPPTTTTATTGEGVVGTDGLTNRQRYDQRRAAELAKHEAEQARIAELDADRPEGVSRYIWDKVKNGGAYNTTLVIRDPDVRDALVGAGYEDYVKGITESSMDSAASHYMGNGASLEDAYATAQNPWYNAKWGAYSNSSVSGVEQGLGFGHEGTDPSEGNTTDGTPTYQPPSTPTTPKVVVDTTEVSTGERQATPFMDSYMRAREAAKKEGPVTGMMKKYME